MHCTCGHAYVLGKTIDNCNDFWWNSDKVALFNFELSKYFSSFQNSKNNESTCSRQDVIVKDKCLNLRLRIFSLYEKTQILDNGTLVINNFGWSDRGVYECLAYDKLGRFKSVFTHVRLEPQYRTNLYYLSLVWGFSTAGGFLLLTLFFKLIHFLLHK